MITPLERAIASTIAGAAPAAPVAVPFSGWVYAEPQCVGNSIREWTVFARHSSGHGVMGRGRTAQEAVADANAKAIAAVPPDSAATCVVFEESTSAERERDNIVSHLKAVMAVRLQEEGNNQSNDWKKGFNEGCLFLLEELEAIGER